MSTINVIRWILVLPCALLGCYAGLLLSEFLFYLVRLAGLDVSSLTSTISVFILSALPPFLFLIFGIITAPSHKIMTIYVLYTIGAIIATTIWYIMLGFDFYLSSLPYLVLVSGLLCAGVLIRIYRIKG